MELKKVAIIGTGAVGSYILWGLLKKPELDVCVIADGERKARAGQAADPWAHAGALE